MKLLNLAVLLIMLHTNPVLANNTDSLKMAIIEAGWLHDWRGQPTQWIDVNGMSAEVHGYVSVDRRIRFYENNKFEINVYKEPNYGSMNISSDNGFPCPMRHSDVEVSVITGKWSVKEDSVYLIYKEENVYNMNEYSEYQSTLGSSEQQKRPKVLRDCRFQRKETYVWSNIKMCLAGAVDLCFK